MKQFWVLSQIKVNLSNFMLFLFEIMLYKTMEKIQKQLATITNDEFKIMNH